MEQEHKALLHNVHARTPMKTANVSCCWPGVLVKVVIVAGSDAQFPFHKRKVTKAYLQFVVANTLGDKSLFWRHTMTVLSTSHPFKTSATICHRSSTPFIQPYSLRMWPCNTPMARHVPSATWASWAKRCAVGKLFSLHVLGDFLTFLRWKCPASPWPNLKPNEVNRVERKGWNKWKYLWSLSAFIQITSNSIGNNIYIYKTRMTLVDRIQNCLPSFWGLCVEANCWHLSLPSQPLLLTHEKSTPKVPWKSLCTSCWRLIQKIWKNERKLQSFNKTCQL